MCSKAHHSQTFVIYKCHKQRLCQGERLGPNPVEQQNRTSLHTGPDDLALPGPHCATVIGRWAWRRCLGPRLKAEVLAMARCSPSIPIEQVFKQREAAVEPEKTIAALERLGEERLRKILE